MPLVLFDRHNMNPAYWESILRSYNLSDKRGQLRVHQVENENVIIGCPLGRKSCELVGATCEGADVCPSGVITMN